MHEAILSYLRDNEGASSVELAKRFLKFKDPGEALAHRALTGILGRDSRCYFGEDRLWHASNAALAGAASGEIRSMPWRAVHVLNSRADGAVKALHVSVYAVFPSPAPVCNQWLENPEALSADEKAALASGLDLPFDRETREDCLCALAEMVREGRPVFLSSTQHALLARQTAMAGKLLTDDITLLSQLFVAAGISLPKPLTLNNCYRAIFEREPVLSAACKYGEALAECVAELFDRLLGTGIATLDDLDAAERAQVAAFDFSGKDFSSEDIINLPRKPAVYAFKDAKGDYLYIGKASNLRRRIMGYFRTSEESPGKLDLLRKEAHSMTIHHCGSELESLVYEYRLIRKYSPRLNKKIGINERKGAFEPLNDCIILLPHAEQDKGMSFWFRRNQKIALKPFYADFRDAESLRRDIEEFFFSHKLPPAPTDFPEQEIVYRWVKRHNEECVFVPVHRMADTGEVLEAMQGYWPEVERS